jgi:hypothetical protein
MYKNKYQYFEGGSLMGDKHDSKHGKKLTTKEKKAQNHLKLMQGSKDRNGATATSNVVAIVQNKDKKAA